MIPQVGQVSMMDVDNEDSMDAPSVGSQDTPVTPGPAKKVTILKKYIKFYQIIFHSNLCCIAFLNKMKGKLKCSIIDILTYLLYIKTTLEVSGIISGHGIFYKNLAIFKSGMSALHSLKITQNLAKLILINIKLIHRLFDEQSVK